MTRRTQQHCQRAGKGVKSDTSIPMVAKHAAGDSIHPDTIASASTLLLLLVATFTFAVGICTTSSCTSGVVVEATVAGGGGADALSNLGGPSTVPGTIGLDSMVIGVIALAVWIGIASYRIPPPSPLIANFDEDDSIGKMATMPPANTEPTPCTTAEAYAKPHPRSKKPTPNMDAALLAPTHGSGGPLPIYCPPSPSPTAFSTSLAEAWADNSDDGDDVGTGNNAGWGELAAASAGIDWECVRKASQEARRIRKSTAEGNSFSSTASTDDVVNEVAEVA